MLLQIKIISLKINVHTTITINYKLKYFLYAKTVKYVDLNLNKLLFLLNEPLQVLSQRTIVSSSIATRNSVVTQTSGSTLARGYNRSGIFEVQSTMSGHAQ